ncbi:hypothetical protein MLD38_019089 [Melastoma candidum]|uniref:Uncharacterized protein n=1 Tax=Melastoma candidum TaxID=119954 RepID=A0ACB9QVW2_9MYRT|nr:hypothetical protein MLD38_019089 [Melastoma candidum]
MHSRNVISWSMMISDYAINEKGEEALALFSRIQDKGTEPNYATYLGVLSACVHVGHVTLVQAIFDCMKQEGHRTLKGALCLNGRSAWSIGDLNEAHSFITNMPMELGMTIWGSLLGASAVH